MAEWYEGDSGWFAPEDVTPVMTMAQGLLLRWLLAGDAVPGEGITVSKREGNLLQVKWQHPSGRGYTWVFVEPAKGNDKEDGNA